MFRKKSKHKSPVGIKFEKRTLSFESPSESLTHQHDSSRDSYVTSGSRDCLSFIASATFPKAKRTYEQTKSELSYLDAIQMMNDRKIEERTMLRTVPLESCSDANIESTTFWDICRARTSSIMVP
jgi:hypothetical protein